MSSFSLRSSQRAVPQGPRGHWLLGHSRLPREDYAPTFARWSRDVGPIFEFRLLPFLSPYIVVNETELAKELMTRRDLAARGGSLNALGTITYPREKGIVFQRWSEEWKDLHRLAATTSFEPRRLEAAVVAEMDDLIEVMTKKDAAFDPETLLRDAFANITSRVVFGVRRELGEASPIHDGLFSLFRDTLASGFEPIYLLFPSAIRFYKTALVQKALASYDVVVNYIDEALQRREETLKDDDEPGCLLDAVAIERRRNPDAEHLSALNVHHGVMDHFFAGTDTMAATLGWTITWLLRRPDVASRLAEDIGRVMDGGAKLSIDSLKDVDYLHAFIDEVLRKTSAAEFTLPHSAMEPVVNFAGFDIPDDKIILANLRACHEDPRLWEEPEVFRPERFLDDNGKYKRNENLIVYGVGTRRCFGELEARMTLQLFVAKLLLKTELALAEGSKVSSLKGRKVLLFWYPEPFQITVKAK